MLDWTEKERIDGLSKAGRHAEAIEAARVLHESSPDDERAQSTLGWALYRAHLKKERLPPEGTPPTPAMLAAVREIVNVCSHSELEFGEFNPVPLSVLAVADVARKAQRWTTVVQCLEQIEIGRVSATPDHFEGKARTSRRERCYGHLVRALSETGAHQQCIQTADAALAGLPVSTGDALWWIRRRKALSLHALGRTAEAAEELAEVADRLDGWYVAHEQALCEIDLGRHEDALRFACAALVSPGPLEAKVNLFRLLAEVLVELDRVDDAALAAATCRAIRLAEGWPADQALEALGLPPVDRPAPSLARQLRARIAPLAGEPDHRLLGTVKKLLPGTAGFLTGADGRDLWFGMPDQTAHAALREGDPVHYRLGSKNNPKTGQKGPIAVDVRASRRSDSGLS